MDVELRRLTDVDLPVLHRWLNEPGVVRWWEGDDVTWDAVVADYGSNSDQRIEHYLASVDGRPVGWIQCVPIAAFPEEAEVQHWVALGIEPTTTAGIDYLIGEPAERGAGLGSAMIATFVTEVVFGRHPAWTRVCAAPLTANVASWRALATAGFTQVGEFEDPHGLCKLMARDRR